MNSTSTFFFTADEDYGHENIIRDCNRPFTSVDEMDADIIKRHNEMVGPRDFVIHSTENCRPSASNGISGLIITIFIRLASIGFVK
jgi:calcineurin-like phosphoesterase family protein